MNDGLDALRADFPSYEIDTEMRSGDDLRRYVAVRREPGPGPHTVVTPDAAELRAELTRERNSAAATP